MFVMRCVGGIASTMMITRGAVSALLLRTFQVHLWFQLRKDVMLRRGLIREPFELYMGSISMD